MNISSIITQNLSFKNYFTDFSLWTSLHYFSIVNRKLYPNMFFYFFSPSGIVLSEMTQSDIQKLLSYITKNKNKLNGMWGYISLLFENKNGEELYKYFCKTEFFEESLVFPCYQEKICDFDNQIKAKVDKILYEKDEKFENILREYENYLKDNGIIGRNKGEKEVSNSNCNDNPIEEKCICGIKNRPIVFAYDNKDINEFIVNTNKKYNNSSNACKELSDLESNINTIVNSNRKISSDISTEVTPIKKKLVKRNFIELNYNDDDLSSNSDKESLSLNSINNNSNKGKKTKKTKSSAAICKENKKNYILNNKKEISFLEHKEKLDGYNSDHTKVVYNNAPLHHIINKNYDCYSDDENAKKNKYRNKNCNIKNLNNEDENENKRKEKIYRINMKGDTYIFNTQLNNKEDNENIGISCTLEDKIDELKRNLSLLKLDKKNRKEAERNEKIKKKNLNRNNQSNKKQKRQNSSNNITNELPIINNTISNSTRRQLDSYFNFDSKAKSTMTNQSNNSNVAPMINNNLAFAKLYANSSSINLNNNRKRNVRKRDHSFDSLSNASLDSFVIKNMTQAKGKQILNKIVELVSNKRFKFILDFYSFNKDKIDLNIQKIKSVTNTFISKSNEIDFDIINTVKSPDGKYILNDKLIINSSQDSNDEKIIEDLFSFYKVKITQFFEILTGNYYQGKENEEEILVRLKISENLIKINIQQINSSLNTNSQFIDSIGYNIYEIFKLFSIFYIENILSSSDYNEIKSICLLIYTFISIVFVIIQKIKNRDLINITKKYIETFTIFLLIKIYLTDINEINNEIISSISLYNLLSEKYFLLENILSTNTNANNLSNISKNYAYEMLKILFSQSILSQKYEIDPQLLYDLSAKIKDDLTKYYSPKVTCLNQETFETSVKTELKKYFIFNLFNIDSTKELPLDIKKIINMNIIYTLIHRYFLTYFLFMNDTGKIETSFIIYYDNLLKMNININNNNNNLNSNNIENNLNGFYYVDTLANKINCINGYYQNKIQKNILHFYFLSDSNLLNILGDKWNIELKYKLIFIFDLFHILNHPYRKNNVIDNKIISQEIFELIPLIDEISNPQISEDDKKNIYSEVNKKYEYMTQFIFNINYAINNCFLRTEIDEVSRKRFSSKFFGSTTPFNCYSHSSSSITNPKITNKGGINSSKQNSNLIINNNISTNYNLSIIPVICILLTSMQFAKNFDEKKNIESIIVRIKEIVDSEKMKNILKSFNLAIWVNISLQLYNKNNDQKDIDKYIQIINNNIKNLISNHNKLESLPQSITQEQNLRECNETILNYIMNLKNISKTYPQMLYANTSIINEILPILDIDHFYSVKFKLEILYIIGKIIDYLEQSNSKSAEVKNNQCQNSNNNVSGDEYDIDMCDLEFDFDDIGINESQKQFYYFLDHNLMKILEKIIKFYDSEKNVNISIKEKILYNLYEPSCCLEAKLYGLFNKYKLLNYDNNKYPVKVFRRTNYLLVTKNNYVPGSDLANYCKLPYKLMYIYLTYNNKLLIEEITNRRYKNTLQYFIILFFISIFTKSDSNFLYNSRLMYQFYKSEEDINNYCSLFIQRIKESKANIESNFGCLYRDKNDYSKIESIKEEYTYYNLLLLIGSINNYKSLNPEALMSSILDRISYKNQANNTIINANINGKGEEELENKIESKYFFGLLDDPLFSYGVEKLKSLCTQIEKNEFVNAMLKIKIYILGKFQNEYINGKCDKYLAIYLNNFLRNISNDIYQLQKCLNSPVFVGYFMKYVNKIASEDYMDYIGRVYGNDYFNDQNNLVEKIIGYVFKKCKEMNTVQLNNIFCGNSVVGEYNGLYDDNNIMNLNKINSVFYLSLLKISSRNNIQMSLRDLLVYYYITLESILNEIYINSKDNDGKCKSFTIYENKINLLLTKMDVSNMKIDENIENFYIIKLFLQKILCFFSFSFAYKMVPGGNLINNIQKLTEIFINYFYWIIYSLCKSEDAIFKVINNKLNRYKLNNPFEFVGDINFKWFNFNTNFYWEVFAINKQMVNILQFYQRCNNDYYERIGFLEYVNNYIRKKLK